MYIKSVIFFHSSDRIMRVIQHYNGRVEENLIKKMRKISSRLLMSCHLKNILIMLYNFVYIFFGLNAWDALKITWIKEWLCNDADGHFQMWAWKVMTFVHEAVELIFRAIFYVLCKNGHKIVMKWKWISISRRNYWEKILKLFCEVFVTVNFNLNFVRFW